MYPQTAGGGRVPTALQLDMSVLTLTGLNLLHGVTGGGVFVLCGCCGLSMAALPSGCTKKRLTIKLSSIRIESEYVNV